MTTDHSRPEPGPNAGVEDLQADIESTRKELGETVGALSSKLDVKERSKQKAADTKERVADKAHTARHAALDDGQAAKNAPVAVLVLAVAVIGIVVWRRRR